MPETKDRHDRIATELLTETEDAAREDLFHRFALYLNEATVAPINRECRLTGFNLPDACKREGECKLEGEWLDFFYVYAIEFLEDLIWAAHGDPKAAQRITKLRGIFEKKEQPPALQRAAQIHAIMHKLRWVTAPRNEHELIELDERCEDGIVYSVFDGGENERVELRDLEALTQSRDPNDKFKNMREHLKIFYERPKIQDLYRQAKEHWHPKATLQSLAVDIYLTQQGYLRRDDRARRREALRRDLRLMRRANLTVFVKGFDYDDGPPSDLAWPMLTQ